MDVGGHIQLQGTRFLDLRLHDIQSEGDSCFNRLEATSKGMARADKQSCKCQGIEGHTLCNRTQLSTVAAPLRTVLCAADQNAI